MKQQVGTTLETLGLSRHVTQVPQARQLHAISDRQGVQPALFCLSRKEAGQEEVGPLSRALGQRAGPGLHLSSGPSWSFEAVDQPFPGSLLRAGSAHGES